MDSYNNSANHHELDSVMGTMTRIPRLASADGFDTAVPDASTASVAFYLDFDRLSDAMAQDDASSDDLDTIEPMKALGATLSQVDGGQRLTMRLVFD